MAPTWISALTSAPSPMISTSSVKISPDSLPSTRTVPSNDSLPSNSLPRPSNVVTSDVPEGCSEEAAPEAEPEADTAAIFHFLLALRPLTRQSDRPTFRQTKSVVNVPGAHQKKRPSRA